MQEKLPWEVIAPYWVYLFALLAGIVGFLEEIRHEDGWRLKSTKFITRIFSSALAGILTFQFLKAMGVSEAWQIPLTGVGAHMGTEALKLLGDLWKRKIGITKDDHGIEPK